MFLKPAVAMAAYPHSKPFSGACVSNLEILYKLLTALNATLQKTILMK